MLSRLGQGLLGERVVLEGVREGRRTVAVAVAVRAFVLPAGELEFRGVRVAEAARGGIPPALDAAFTDGALRACTAAMAAGMRGTHSNSAAAAGTLTKLKTANSVTGASMA